MDDTLELVEGERSLRGFQRGHSETGASTLQATVSFLPEALHAAGARAVVGLLKTGIALRDETVDAGGEKRENFNSWYRFSRDHKHNSRCTELHPKPGSTRKLNVETIVPEDVAGKVTVMREWIVQVGVINFSQFLHAAVPRGRSVLLQNWLRNGYQLLGQAMVSKKRRRSTQICG